MKDVSKLTKTELIEKLKELETEYEDLEQRYNDLDDCYAELENQLYEGENEDTIDEIKGTAIYNFLWELQTNSFYQKELFEEVIECLAESGVRFEVLDEQVNAEDIKFADWMANRIVRVIEKHIDEFQFGNLLVKGVIKQK